MHWIEQLWHIDPDHGSGALETALLLMVALVVLAAGARGRLPARKGSHTRH